MFSTQCNSRKVNGKHYERITKLRLLLVTITAKE